jgi:DNA-binding NtrC family response regulator
LLVLGSVSDVGVDEVEAALDNAAVAAVPTVMATSGADFSLPLREAREQFERAYLLHQLNAAGGSVGKLAKAVGMERTHLYRKLKDLAIDPRAANREG